MEVQYYKEYSQCLKRDMEFKVYGQSGGKPVLAVPCQDGHFYDWENFGMLDVLRDYIEGGTIQLFTCETIDKETLSDVWGDPHHRAWLHDQWVHYITDELCARMFQINDSNQAALVTGFSMGAYHAANLFFRRPDIFDSVISLSGVYDLQDSFKGAMDDNIYRNDPCASISGMPADHPYIGWYNDRKICICVGQGAWEEPLLEATRRFDTVLKSKGINAWVDYWGLDVNHDWPWWKKQIRYFLPHVLG